MSATRRTTAPASHSGAHVAGGSDAIKIDDLASPDDNTDLDVSASAHGLTPKIPDNTTTFLRGDGTWAAPGGGGKAVLAWGGILPNSAVTRYPLRYYFGTPTSAASSLDYTAKIIVPFAGTIRNLFVEIDSAYVVSTNFTVQKNGADQAVTVASGTSVAKFSDTSNSFSVAAGDEVSIKWVGQTSCGSRAACITLELAAS